MAGFLIAIISGALMSLQGAFITVNVINAPITPPRSVIILSTLNSFMISGLPSITHMGKTV